MKRWADILRRDGIELVLDASATAARLEGSEYVLALADAREMRGDRILVATGCARVPLEVLRDTIQPFPSFSEIFGLALHTLHAQIAAASPSAVVELTGPGARYQPATEAAHAL